MKTDDLLRMAERHSDVFFHGDGKPTYVFDEIGLQMFIDEFQDKLNTEQDIIK